MNGRLLGVVLLSGAVLAPVPAALAAPAHDRAADPVQIVVTDISPSTPAASQTARPFTVQLDLTNNTDTDYTNVRIVAERGYPISSQQQLDKALANPAPPATNGVPIPATHPTRIDIPAGAAHVPVTFTTTTTIQQTPGLCICATSTQPLIYPLYFSAHVTGPGGVDQRLGAASSLVPSFLTRPAPVHVAWLWPLIDRPHRLASETEFTDDDLAGLVTPTGRLTRALEVAENVGPHVPITLVVDPELLAELQVMSTGTYTVNDNGKKVPGTGGPDATAWLSRLRAMLTADPLVQLELTPYADPDIESLSSDNLAWAGTLPTSIEAAVTTALGAPPPPTTIAWPAAGAISQSTLTTLAHVGIGTVVLNDTAVSPRTDANGVPTGLARLSAANTDIAAAVTTAALQKYVSQAVTLGVEPGALPELVAEIAVRAAQEPDTEHVAVLTAPRYVDPDVAAATRAIDDTSTSPFAQPISLRSAVGGALLPVGRSRLAKVPASAAALPDVNSDAAELTHNSQSALASMLDPAHDAAARGLLTELPISVQRVESSAWRTQHALGAKFAQQLNKQVQGVLTGVQIVHTSGSYTLGSANSPLPITVHNGLPYGVRVLVRVTAVVNVPGFSTKAVGVQSVDPQQNRTLNLPTNIQRSGRFLVDAQLLTPNGVPLGNDVQLTVHSTALGAIGVVITIAAGVVLFIALLVRLGLRLRKRRGPLPPPRVELDT